MTSGNDFEPIKPAEVPLTHTSQASSPTPLPWQQRPTTYIALGISVLVALIVIFVLPSLIKPPETPAVVIESKTTSQHVSSVKESPFKDAQLAKARRESQDSLSKLLEKQSFLEKRNVLQWGEAAFQSALQKASEGDLLYRQRQFDEAQTAYQDALEQLSTLETQIPQKLANVLENGDKAFASGNAVKAKTFYELALAIDPANQQAKSSIARTTTLDQVLVLVDQGNNALANQQLEQAHDLFVQALTIDAQHQGALNGKEQVKKLISDRDFNSAMSRGYQALESNQFNNAAKAFRQALKIRPGDKAANSGLTQANTASAQYTTRTQLTKASRFESKEQWHQARDIYNRILARDNSVVEAKLGQIRSSARADLSDAINKILKFPLRLSSDNVFRQAQQVLKDAKGIRSPGPKHSQQLAQLQEVLQIAVTPVTVNLRSDNTTKVTLFKVGELGLFNEKQLSLKPGNYIAVGSRSGYRDVRVEFQVTAQGLSAPVEVACREPIS